MIRNTPRRTHVFAVSLVAVIALCVAACSSSSKSTASDSPASTSPGSSPAATITPTKLAPATLLGSGSTFQQAFDQEAISQFTQEHSGVNITYSGGGSGKGQTDLASKLVDFAGTDSPIAAADLPKFGGADAILYFPTVAAPITLSYNLSGVDKLTLTAPTTAKIFAGTITTWNDPAIAADNPGVTLPSTKITPVHRSDSSGTTSNFTLYLTKAAPADWKLGTGKTVAWTTGLTGNGNGGVAQAIKSTGGAIGYVDYSDAKASGLKFASVKNSSGKVLAPTLEGASAAVAAATVNPDLTYDPINTSAPDAYPITAPTWIVIYKQQSDQNKGAALKSFLGFILTIGQKSIAPDTDFAPLSPDLLTKATAQLGAIVIP